MSINPVSSGAALALNVVAAGQPPDANTQKAQANAQADLLQALRGVNLSKTAAARVSDGKGVDLYM